MSEMVERVAAALSAHLEQLAEGSAFYADGYEDETVIFDGSLNPQALVRRLLTAMREPTEAMLEASLIDDGRGGDVCPSLALKVWQAMIDAALKTA